MIKVLKPGLATAIQDLGREGYYHLGIPPSGAMDSYALRAANLLVGNAPGAAALECTLLGPELQFAEDALVALSGAFAVGGIALHRGETINAMWLVVAAICVYAIGYRFYSAWVVASVLSADAGRATPALRLNNGRDFMPTHRWIVFGHHFAAIAGPGPLIGPTLAAQFGYLPGTLWILVGAVLGGCVQDMTILFLSTRRDGRSLGQMARDELGPVGGLAAIVGTLTIMIILIAVLGLVVVNAMKHSPWATATVFAPGRSSCPTMS